MGRMKTNQFKSFLLPGLGLLAIGFVAAGNYLVWPKLQALGAAMLGVGLLSIGIDSIRLRYFDMKVGEWSWHSSSRFVFRGTGAAFWGLLFVAMGLGTLAIAGIVIFELGPAAEKLIMARPGILIAPLGFIFLCTAIGWLWGDEQMNASVLMFVVTLPHRIGAVVTLIFALAVFGLGVFELLQPEAFDDLVRSLRPPNHPMLPK